MSAKLFVDKKADKQFLKLPSHIQKKIIRAYRAIKENPVSGIKLHGELKDYYKFRIGDYRVVYRFSSKEKVVYVVKIEHRQGVYR